MKYNLSKEEEHLIAQNQFERYERARDNGHTESVSYTHLTLPTKA